MENGRKLASGQLLFPALFGGAGKALVADAPFSPLVVLYSQALVALVANTPFGGADTISTMGWCWYNKYHLHHFGVLIQ